MASLSMLWRRHDHGSMDMEDDDMNVGTIDVTWFPKLYWIIIGTVIGVFWVAYLINAALLRQRLRTTSRSAAQPHNALSQIYATLTAVVREIANASIASLGVGQFTFRQPTIGKVVLVLANAILLMVLCFYALNPSSIDDYENVAYRCGFLSLAQLPLIFLLAGKKNIIGWLIGTSYERLNWLHRWVSRTLLVTVTFHLAFWFRDWAPYDYIGHQLKEDRTTQTGFSAWIILIWIVFSSFAPIRKWSYEIFVIQHLVSMVAFVVMIFLHTPSSDHGWIWAPVAIYLFDRVVRAGYAAYINLSFFHPRQRRLGNMPGLWSCRAELTPLDDGVTKVTVRNPPLKWRAGQHAFISCHSIAPLQSHPFTISSLSTDNKLEVFIKARNGGTRRFFNHARSQLVALDTEEASQTTVPIAIEGPYGRMRDLRQFDSVVLVAGSTGATFTIPLLRDLISHWKNSKSCCSKTNRSRHFWEAPAGAVTRRIRFVWVVKSRTQLMWFVNELHNAIEDVQSVQKEGLDVRLEVQAYVTCDEIFTSDFAEKLPAVKAQGATEIILSSGRASTSNELGGEKEKQPLDDGVEIREIDSRLESGSDVSSIPQGDPATKLKTCQPDGTCCCRTAISSDEGAEHVICNCNGCSHDDTSPTASAVSSTTGRDSDPRKPATIHPDIVLRSGRPTARHLLLPVLEEADGETAVVACGPIGLNDEVRRTTVALSDERAVHKGTGAQGIWFWGEGFGY